MLFKPQQRTAPAEVSAQVWALPAAIPTTPELRPVTPTGTVDWVVVLLPSWPLAFAPQHCTPPEALIAQLCALPLATPEAAVEGVKIGVTLVEADSVTTQVPEPLQPPPDQPLKV